MPRVHVPYPSRVAGTSKLNAQPRAHASDGRTLCRIRVRITVLRDYISCPPSATETRCDRHGVVDGLAPSHLQSPPHTICRDYYAVKKCKGVAYLTPHSLHLQVVVLFSFFAKRKRYLASPIVQQFTLLIATSRARLTQALSCVQHARSLSMNEGLAWREGLDYDFE